MHVLNGEPITANMDSHGGQTLARVPIGGVDTVIIAFATVIARQCITLQDMARAAQCSHHAVGMEMHAIMAPRPARLGLLQPASAH